MKKDNKIDTAVETAIEADETIQNEFVEVDEENLLVLIKRLEDLTEDKSTEKGNPLLYMLIHCIKNNFYSISKLKKIQQLCSDAIEKQSKESCTNITR